MNAEDADAFFVLNSHPGVMRLAGEPRLRSVDEARTAIENRTDFDTVGYGCWACESKATGLFMGFCGLKYRAELAVVDVGLRFLPEHRGKGFATEACAASIALASGSWTFRKASVWCSPTTRL